MRRPNLLDITELTLTSLMSISMSVMLLGMIERQVV
jgi:hypothetical protein